MISKEIFQTDKKQHYEVNIYQNTRSINVRPAPDKKKKIKVVAKKAAEQIFLTLGDISDVLKKVA